ncbi:uncharacterized protein O3C94_012113 isoform 2-T2 [Discoglossus pictus]
MANAQSPLQDKYELLASSLAQVLHVSVWAKLKAVWCTHMSPRELQTARTFILSLLNRGQVSLWDITNLKRQLEDLGDRKGVQLCQEYEDHVTHHLQDISCNAVKSMPSTDFFQPLQSCDYDGDLSTPVILQISNITIAEKIDDRPPDSLWSEDVVSGFTNLPDFSPMEAEALLPFLQPPAKCPVPCVQQFLLEFQSQPDARAKLRDLAQHLKKLQRVDVVASMHKQKTLLQSLGPVLPEEQPIKDMKISLWQQVTTALSITKPTGNDWTWLADKLRIPRSFVELWQQRSSHPAAEVLKSWEVKVSEATVGRLFDLMMEMEREDVASML